MSAPRPTGETGVASRDPIMLIAPQPFFRATGTPINVKMMCRALTESGHAVHLLTLPYGEDLAMPGLVLHRVPRLPWIRDVRVGFSIAKLLYNVLLALAVLGLLCRRRFTVVHAVEESAFYAIPLARLFGIATVIDLDSDLARQLRDDGSLLARALCWAAVRLRRAALRRSAAVISVARRMSEIARAERPDAPLFEITDVPVEAALRAPDPIAMAVLRAELGIEGRRLIVYTGNVDRRQGLEVLIRAMPEVLRHHPDVRLLVVGGDPAGLRVLHDLVCSLNLQDTVHLIGKRPLETMAEFMGLADVLVSPRTEPHATPLKIFSYMASGRPIVATDLPTHTQVLDAETAILVAPTEAGLARGLHAALAEPAAAIARGERAQRRVATHHTYTRFKRQLAEAYARVLSEPKVARERDAVEDAAASSMADPDAAYDLIVVGGGVYGIMTALEATRRRLRPLLLEKGDFAGATSANSLRILHGGLRYLQSADLGRAIVSVRERAWWMRHFPGLTRPLACLMPLYGDGLRRPQVLRLALALNERICRWQKAALLPPGRVLEPAEVRELCPTLAAPGLRGGALWYDAVAPDTTRLLREALNVAERAGAVALDRCEALGASLEDDRIAGVRARDLRTGQKKTFRAPLVINTAGPWAADVAVACGAPAAGLVRPLLAWNVVFDRAPLSECALAVRARQPGTQTWFLLPMDGRLGAGTGYAPWSGGADHLALPEPDLERFIAALNAAVPGLDLTRREVLRVHAGLLPADGSGARPAERPVIIDHGAEAGPAGLYSVSGVKLTTARAVAAEAFARAMPAVPAPEDPVTEPAFDAR